MSILQALTCLVQFDKRNIEGFLGLRCDCNVVLHGIHFMVTKILSLIELISENVDFPLDLVISHQIAFLPRH